MSGTVVLAHIPYITLVFCHSPLPPSPPLSGFQMVVHPVHEPTLFHPCHSLLSPPPPPPPPPQSLTTLPPPSPPISHYSLPLPLSGFQMVIHPVHNPTPLRRFIPQPHLAAGLSRCHQPFLPGGHSTERLGESLSGDMSSQCTL